VKLASHAVPNREKLLAAIFGHSLINEAGEMAESGGEGEENRVQSVKSMSNEEIDKVAEEFLTCMEQVYDRVQRMYEENNLLELP
jgi:hypothetical protein